MSWTPHHEKIHRRIVKRGIYPSSTYSNARNKAKMANAYNKAWLEEEIKEKAKRKVYYKKRKKISRSPIGFGMWPY